MSRVDVIVPCYNYGEMLEACVRSVLDQHDVDVRVLVMDDGSTDSTEHVGRRLAAADPRVEYRRHAVNHGHIATYNEALELVTGDYCMVLSADDLLTPGALVRATRVMDAHRNVGLCYGRDITFQYVPPVAASRQTSHCSYRIMGYLEFLERSCRLGHTPIQSPTAIVRTSLHREIGDYRPELPHSGDTEIWLRMAAHADVCELDADQAFRRLHAHNMSLLYAPIHRLEEQQKAFDAHFERYRDSRPAIAELERIARRTIAEKAMWSAAHAFDAGDSAACEAFLAFAARTCADVESSRPWRRLRWKRRIGSALWRRLAPIRSLAKASAAAQ
jgi:glycosyltransferase involved in cell wall biosynthesis